MWILWWFKKVEYVDLYEFEKDVGIDVWEFNDDYDLKKSEGVSIKFSFW